MNPMFDREKLEVYQESLRFVGWLEPLLEKLPKSLSVREQLDRASTSMPLNLAEGNGKFTKPDRCRFFDISADRPWNAPPLWMFWSPKTISPQLTSCREKNV